MQAQYLRWQLLSHIRIADIVLPANENIDIFLLVAMLNEPARFNLELCNQIAVGSGFDYSSSAYSVEYVPGDAFNAFVRPVRTTVM